MKDMLGLALATVAIVVTMLCVAPILSGFANPTNAQIDTSLFVP